MEELDLDAVLEERAKAPPDETERKKAVEEDKPLAQQAGSALFWGPEDNPYKYNEGDNDEGNPNPDLAALQALDEESTPEEKCDALKEQGNDLLSNNATKWAAREAVQSYTNALSIDGSSEMQRLRVLNNRSKAHFRIGNNRSSLEDARAAMSIDSTNAKAAFRACKACLLLGRLHDIFSYAAAGLKSEPWNQELKRLRERAEELLQQRAAREQREAELDAEATNCAQQVAAALQWRNISVSRPVFDSHGEPRPWIDNEGVLHWRVLILYPEVGQSDILQDVPEEATIGAVLDTLLQQPPAWDSHHAYVRSAVELVYQRQLAEPLEHDALVHWLAGRGVTMEDEASPKERALAHSRNNIAHAPEDQALWQVFSSTATVVPGHPVFFALSKRSNFRDKVWKGEEDIG